MKIYYRSRTKRSTGKQVLMAWLGSDLNGKEDLLNLCRASGVKLSQSFEYAEFGNIWAPVDTFMKLTENAALLGYEFVEEEEEDDQS